MSVINLSTPPRGVHNGKQITFIAPCDCTQATAVSINGVDYTLVDALGNDISSCGNVFKQGNAVSVTINVTNSTAVLNSDAFDDFSGATTDTSGKKGLVPTPEMGTDQRFLSADGTWKEVSSQSFFTFLDVAVTEDMWVSGDTEYTDYPYKASIEVEGVTADCYGEVIFDDILKMNCLDVAETADNCIYIWGKEPLEGNISSIVYWTSTPGDEIASGLADEINGEVV